MRKESLVLIHTLLVILVWLSPFWLDWKIILAGIFLLILQEIVFKGCILTNLQFSKKINKKVEDTMYSYYLEKLGLKPNKRKIRFLARNIFPWIIFIISILWQILLNNSVLFKI
ncbi:Uncharacterised protein [uncultured archaeon]|nr:Uncharacterised protein [uncultured archaeon]